MVALFTMKYENDQYFQINDSLEGSPWYRYFRSNSMGDYVVRLLQGHFAGSSMQGSFLKLT